jgi:hypothetical protein
MNLCASTFDKLCLKKDKINFEFAKSYCLATSLNSPWPTLPLRPYQGILSSCLVQLTRQHVCYCTAAYFPKHRCARLVVNLNFFRQVPGSPSPVGTCGSDPRKGSAWQQTRRPHGPYAEHPPSAGCQEQGAKPQPTG